MLWLGRTGSLAVGRCFLSSLRPLTLSAEGEIYNVPGTFYYQMAEFDILTNGTNYQSDLLQYFELVQSHHPLNFSDDL
jgi:hypothetical protein